MPQSAIVVQRRGGGYVKGARVVLGFEFSHHPLSAGNTDAVFTNSDGEASIRHSNTGRATVYIDGDAVGTMNTPERKHIFV